VFKNIAQHSFDLSETFLGKYKNKQPDWGPVGYFTFKRTYARSQCHDCGSYALDYNKEDDGFDWYCTECGSEDMRTGS